MGDLIRDVSVRNFLTSQFKVKAVVFRVNKIFRDRPINETFIICRSKEELKSFDDVAEIFGSMPCAYSCFEMLNNFKMLNIFQ